jgi:hypothetical protein
MNALARALGVAVLPGVLAGVVAVGPASASPVAPGSFVIDGGDLERAEGPVATGPSAAPGPGSLRLAAERAAEEPGGESPSASEPRPVAFEYSDGYYRRLKVHRYASYATLPLFATQVVLGQKLYGSGYSEGTRDAHRAVAIGTATLFGVNTVTGVMNLWEGRKDPNKSTRRRAHAALMLAADAGFVATGLLAPDSKGGGDRSAHRTVALASMGVATAAYLIMIIGR